MKINNSPTMISVMDTKNDSSSSSLGLRTIRQGFLCQLLSFCDFSEMRSRISSKSVIVSCNAPIETEKDRSTSLTKVFIFPRTSDVEFSIPLSSPANFSSEPSSASNCAAIWVLSVLTDSLILIPAPEILSDATVKLFEIVSIDSFV